MSGVGCRVLRGVRCLLFVVRCIVSGVRCGLPVGVCCLLLQLLYVMFAGVCCLSLGRCCLALFVAGRRLFCVVWCLLFAVK